MWYAPGFSYVCIKATSRKLKGPTARVLVRKQTALRTQKYNEKLKKIEKNLRKRAIWLKTGFTYPQIDPNFEFY